MVQMPALNTPQFDWCETKLPNDPQPAPRIFQPEVGAEAVYYAAHHRRRELYVGRSSVGSILLNKIAPHRGRRMHIGWSGHPEAARIDPAAHRGRSLVTRHLPARRACRRGIKNQ